MPDKCIHAFRDDALGYDDAVGVAERVRRGEVSTGEVVAAAIARCRAVDPTLAAVAEEDFDRATARAANASADTAGAFGGVPTFIKDLTPVEGLTMRFGSRAFDNAKPATKTAPLVRQLFDMGLINLGTSTLPEFGFTPSAEFPDAPPTRNPWNTDRTAGGSSGGAAALVAAGVVPIAHGADGGGSIRIPAGCCGLIGLKCTRGRLLQEAAVRMMPVNIVVEGVLSRSVRDTAVYFAESEKRYRNPALPPIGLADRPLDRPLRVGTLLQSPAGAVVDSATRQTFEQSIDLLTSLGHEIVPVDVPIDEQFVKDFCHYYAMGGYIVSRAGKFAFGRDYNPDALTDLTLGLARAFVANKWNSLGVIRRLRRSAAEYAAFFKNVDVILSPVVAQIPPSVGHLGMDLPYDVLFPRVVDWACYTALCNATGGPSISLPLGHDPESNCPVGMCFSAPHGAERLLLELGFQIEAARPWTPIWDCAG